MSLLCDAFHQKIGRRTLYFMKVACFALPIGMRVSQHVVQESRSHGLVLQFPHRNIFADMRGLCLVNLLSICEILPPVSRWCEAVRLPTAGTETLPVSTALARASLSIDRAVGAHTSRPANLSAYLFWPAQPGLQPLYAAQSRVGSLPNHAPVRHSMTRKPTTPWHCRGDADCVSLARFPQCVVVLLLLDTFTCYN